jgi:putative hydrolase
LTGQENLSPKSLESMLEHLNGEGELGAQVVVVHGETVTEPVAPGTNAAAVRCPDVDILAHPGLLTEEDASAAALNDVYLEITARKGHSAANGRVAGVAARAGARVLFGTDTHAPGDLATVDHARKILMAAGIPEHNIDEVFANAEQLLKPLGNLSDWEARVTAIGHGQRSELGADEALEIANISISTAEASILDDIWPSLKEGDPVTVTPTDYGDVPVAGTLLQLSHEDIAIRRTDARAGELVVHFPRIGYRLEKQ